MRRSGTLRDGRAARLAVLVLVVAIGVLVLPRPALAQGIVVSPSCERDDDGDTTDDGILTVTIDAGLNENYDVFLDDIPVASNVPSGDEFEIGPVVDGRHTLFMDRVTGAPLDPVTIDVDCTTGARIAVADAPAGGVATGGGGTASDGSGPSTALLVALTCLLLAVGSVVLSRGRLARR